MAHRLAGDGSAHGVAGDAHLLLVDEGVAVAGVVHQVDHVGELGAAVDDIGVAVVVGVAGDDHEAAAGQLAHVLILVVKVVVAAVLDNDEGELVFRARFFGDVDLGVDVLAIIHDDADVLHVHSTEVGHEGRGENAAEKAEDQGDAKENLAAFFHGSFLSFL